MALTEEEQIKPACRVPFLPYATPVHISWTPDILRMVEDGKIKGGLAALEWDYLVERGLIRPEKPNGNV